MAIDEERYSYAQIANIVDYDEYYSVLLVDNNDTDVVRIYKECFVKLKLSLFSYFEDEFPLEVEIENDGRTSIRVLISLAMYALIMRVNRELMSTGVTAVATKKKIDNFTRYKK